MRESERVRESESEREQGSRRRRAVDQIASSQCKFGIVWSGTVQIKRSWCERSGEDEMHTRNDLTGEPSPPQNRGFLQILLHILFLTLVYHPVDTGNQNVKCKIKLCIWYLWRYRERSRYSDKIHEK